eukprot:3111687-Amphidinium_carterae.1
MLIIGLLPDADHRDRLPEAHAHSVRPIFVHPWTAIYLLSGYASAHRFTLDQHLYRGSRLA